LKKDYGSNLGMLDEYALVPDIFDSSAYSNPAFIEMCLPHLKEPILREALVRDLCGGGWSQFWDDKDKVQRLFDPAVRADKLKWHFAIGEI
jgi:hypothetical protein